MSDTYCDMTTKCNRRFWSGFSTRGGKNAVKDSTRSINKIGLWTID